MSSQNLRGPFRAPSTQELSELELQVREQMGAPIALRGATLVREQFESEPKVWQGTVFCFSHADGECFAWTRYLPDEEACRSVIVASGPGVQSPRDAVRSFLLEGSGTSWLRAS